MFYKIILFWLSFLASHALLKEASASNWFKNFKYKELCRFLKLLLFQKIEEKRNMKREIYEQVHQDPSQRNEIWKDLD